MANSPARGFPRGPTRRPRRAVYPRRRLPGTSRDRPATTFRRLPRRREASRRAGGDCLGEPAVSGLHLRTRARGVMVTDWWTVPYPKNPSPPNVELPRTLEVGCPDAEDVIAMKRGVWRGGRWPGP